MNAAKFLVLFAVLACALMASVEATVRIHHRSGPGYRAMVASRGASKAFASANGRHVRAYGR